MSITTSLGYSYAKVKHGTGTKLAFLTRMNANGDFFGHCFKGPWKKTLTGKQHELYKTERKIALEDIISRWRNLPSVKSYINAN